METRLKNDILTESKLHNGLLLVHDELSTFFWFLEEDNSDIGKIIPIWTTVEIVETPREIFENFIKDGYRIKYIRIPISPEQAPEDCYIDEYINVIRKSDPNEALIFNCGMGVGRSFIIFIYSYFCTCCSNVN